ncbi:MAG: hypothetical protein H7Z13_18335, partial [Ferruginibacter sp.]|nr:hypothetical protein [Ferruginibacter sp.]
MKQLLCFFLLTSAACRVNAQTARDSIINTVNRLFEAMKNADTILLRDCFSANAVLHTIKHDKDDIKVMEGKIADFIAFV